jgi:hypothetical protein
VSGVRLPRQNEEFLNQICTELRKSGASEADIDKATLGLQKAIFADSRTYLPRAVLRLITSTITFLLIFGPGLLISYNDFSSTKLLLGKHEIINIVYFWFVVGVMFTALKPKVSLQRFLDIEQSRGWELTKVLGILGYTGATVAFAAFLIWHESFINMNIWRAAFLILSAAWVFSHINIIYHWSLSVKHRILAFLRPESALIISLCKAFCAVRNEASWHDQTYRNRIAGDLAVAADAIEKFMPDGVAAETGFSSWIAVRQRFKENAIPLREQIVWLATPGPLTRPDLEAELRSALIAASEGELARLEEFLKRFPDRMPPNLVEARPWRVVVFDLCRAIAWALTPLALVQLGSALQWPLRTRSTSLGAESRLRLVVGRYSQMAKPWGL